MSRLSPLPVMVAGLLLAACVATRSPPPVAPAPPPAALDASYDWRVLLGAPFGILLKDLPFTVHEVLLFEDAAAHKPSQTDDAECYATDASAPKFLDRMPEQYLLCFKHDRLARIVAVVRLAQPGAFEVFSDACYLWLKPAGVINGLAPTIAAQRSGEICAGRDGAIRFSARLESGSEQQGSDDALFSVTLNAAEPD